jgi:N-methylhydantoinase B/oxoprolinase/acetone carboxylase alpha subunit
LRTDFDRVAEERCQKLVEAHERYSRFFSKASFEVAAGERVRIATPGGGGFGTPE